MGQCGIQINNIFYESILEEYNLINPKINKKNDIGNTYLRDYDNCNGPVARSILIDLEPGIFYIIVCLVCCFTFRACYFWMCALMKCTVKNVYLVKR